MLEIKRRVHPTPSPQLDSGCSYSQLNNYLTTVKSICSSLLISNSSLWAAEEECIDSHIAALIEHDKTLQHKQEVSTLLSQFRKDISELKKQLSNSPPQARV